MPGGSISIFPARKPFRLDPKSPVLYYLQRLRDEAHRFAIGSHRKKRSAAIGANPLDEIAGVGAGRKRALLQHFGSARAVAAASLTDLEAVGGVSGTLAQENLRLSFIRMSVHDLRRVARPYTPRMIRFAQCPDHPADRAGAGFCRRLRHAGRCLAHAWPSWCS